MGLKRILCKQLPLPGRAELLDEHEAHHLTRVFRLADGAEVEAIDGKGHGARAVLRLRSGKAYLEATGKALPVETAQQTVPLVLELAALKGDAMEWATEKAVELGVEKLQPVLTAHTIVQMKNKGPEVFQGRWQKIADQALKQCGRLSAMEILAPVELDALVAQKLASPTIHRLWFDDSRRESVQTLGGYLGGVQPRPSGFHILIGPEGGWSSVENKILSESPQTLPLSLGPLVLRAETAAIAAAATLAVWLRK